MMSSKIVINPRRMREGYGSRSVCVCVCLCVCVCYHVRQLLHTDANKAPLGFSRHFQSMNCVDFVENASFKSSGNINFADHHGLLHFLMSSRSMKETAMASFQD